MKKLRKVGALLVALALIVSMFSMNGLVAFAEETAGDTTVSTDATVDSATDETTAAPIEEVSEETAEAAALLQSLNILKGDEEGNLNLTGDVTRAEFATFVVRMMGQESVALASAGQQIFNDVAADHWGNGYITVAYNAGVIQGYGDGNFGPENPVTYEQAIKMIVCALGYGAVAEDRGGWTTGYLLVANDMKITKGIKILSETAAKRGDIVAMIYNSLELDVMRSTKVIENGQEAISYTVVEGENVLTYYLGLEKAEGIVTANGYTRLNSSGKTPVKDTQIEIGYVDKFEIGETDAAKYLGHAVDAYCIPDATLDTRTLVFVKPQSRSSEIVVAGEEISNATTLSELVWGEDDTEDSADIESGANVIVNNRYKGTVGERIVLADIMPDNGAVTLIDSNGNGSYETIVVSAYQTIVVTKTVSSLDSIYDLYTDTGYELDVDSKTETVTIKNTAGEDVALEDIAQWDVVCLYQSGDGTVKEAVVSTQTVKGKISKKTSDDEYTIDGTVYELSNTYKNYLSTHTNAVPALGTTYTFLLDIDGRIAGRESTGMTLAEGQKYGYLIKTSKDGVNDKIRLYIYTTGGQFKYFDMAEKVKVNGYPKNSTTTDANDLYFANERKSRNMISTTPADLIANTAYYNSIFTAGAVTYTLNAANEITELRVDTAGTNYYPDYDSRYDGQFVKAVSSVNPATHLMGVLNGKYRITSKTVGLQIPNDLNEKDFFMPALPELSSLYNSNIYALDLYDVKENGEVGLAVLRMDYEATLNVINGTIYAVQGLGERLNADDEIVTELNLISGSTERIKNIASPSYYVDNSASLTSAQTLQTQIEAAYANEGTNVRVDYRAATPSAIDDLRFGDIGFATVKNNVYASYLPVFKMTGIDTVTGADVSLKDYHFEIAQHDATEHVDFNDIVPGKTIADLTDNNIPTVLDDNFWRYYRVTFYGEATESSTTSVRMFTVTKDDGNGNLYHKERIIPATNVTVTIIDMDKQTITSGAVKDIVPGDKVLFTYNYDIKGNIYVYRW